MRRPIAMKLMPLLILLVSSLTAQNGSPFHWNGRLQPGQTLEIRGIHGSITAEPGTGDAEVNATRKARNGDPNAVRIVATPTAEGMVVCALYPNKSGYTAHDCNEKTNGSYDNNTVVDFTARVPAGVNVRLSSVHGDVIARGLTADVRLNTVHGDIRAQAGRVQQANTVHGSIEVESAKLDDQRGARLSTVHGDVRLKVTSPVNAALEANTVHGKIHSDVPVTMNTFDRHQLRGTLGSGGPRLQMTTVHGDVSLTR